MKISKQTGYQNFYHGFLISSSRLKSSISVGLILHPHTSITVFFSLETALAVQIASTIYSYLWVYLVFIKLAFLKGSKRSSKKSSLS